MDDFTMDDVFGEQGILRQLLPGYEERREQTEMANFIRDRLVAGGHCCIEAGTGTGKTLAYLVPALAYAIETGKKISISTETKALQKQLVDKDLPLVKKLFTERLGADFTFSLCLGGANYPCRKRLEHAIARGRFTESELAKIESLLVLMKDRKIVTRFDVAFSNALWSQVCREPDACAPNRCGVSSHCSWQRARREWTQSQVLVMNHYLFFSHVAVDAESLPQTEIAIFDEAHAVEEIASSMLGFSLRYSDLQDILGRFYKERKRTALVQMLEKEERKKTAAFVKEIGTEAQRYFESLRALFPRGGTTLRLREPVRGAEKLVERGKEFLQFLLTLEDSFGLDEGLYMEFDIARSRLFQFTENLATFAGQTGVEFVYWLERSADELLGDVVCRAQPVSVSEIMTRKVSGTFESVLLVSATLAVNQNFSYITGRLGIAPFEGLILRSPFDHARQMVLYIARDLADPGDESYNRVAAEAAAGVVEFLGGNCLLLFTSYRMLSAVKRILPEYIDNPIHSQDELPTAEALARYLRDDNSILMGTHSFWQGIDLPGDLLRGVIIMKLPFSVPDSPPVQAKTELLKERGMNPFYDYQVPEAVIRFKQGVGRLIRSRSDRGIVAVLDSRLWNKSYGKLFQRAIPVCPVAYSMEELEREYALIAPSESS